MYQHAALALRGCDKEHTEQVGRQAGPRGVGYGGNRSVKIVFDFVGVLRGHNDIAVGHCEVYAQTAECIGNYTEIFGRYVGDGKIATRKRGHAYKRTYLYHVGEHGVLGAVQAVSAVDAEQIAADALDLHTHTAQHAAELLNIRLASSIVDSSDAFGCGGSHDDVGRTGHRGLVEKHVASFKMIDGHKIVGLTLLVVAYHSSEFYESGYVGVHSAASDLVAARFGEISLTGAGQQRTHHQHRAAKRCAAGHEVSARYIFFVKIVGLKAVTARSQFLHFHTHRHEQAYEVGDIKNVGDVMDDYGLGGEERCAYHLKSFVFCALRLDGTVEAMTAFNYVGAQFL